MTHPDQFDVAGTVVFVAGGGGAIGRAIGSAYAERGARVAFASQDPERVAAAAAPFADRALGIVFDATDEQECASAIDQTVDRFGRVDIIVNAIGGGAGKVLFDAQDYPRDAWDWIFELNVRGAVLPTQAAVKRMIDQGDGGKVLNICSVRAQLGIAAGYSAYVAAKGAIASLTRQWATEWAPHGINVNAISPTFVDTPQVAMLLADPDFKASLVDRIPLGRVGTTDDIVGPALFFGSSASSFVTGQILTIDGGLTACQ
ncbi:SDR family oxidoreductase [Isoptericola sp. b490]|uniref:SDR family NAD(P)-dependent oxidoreductase n=1 Tax=Actinotalea lenta TaxID=3064654 RepID=UPI002712F65D|nr:SDR family oxidoreductase [Isoptericola sp. b490]MDO8119767.1 SDR family oxidoreductase [Isoptericola sp. b490]